MIFGIGVDQVDIKRVRSLLEKSGSKFENRCFTVDEILYSKRFSDPAKRLSARFAAKEAIMKSLVNKGRIAAKTLGEEELKSWLI